MAEANKSLLSKLRFTKNLEKFFDKNTAKQLILENSACCGLGRKKVTWITKNGIPTKITYPHTFPDLGFQAPFQALNNVIVKNKEELAEFLTKLFNAISVVNKNTSGYIVLVDNCNCFYVLGAAHLKDEQGRLIIAEDEIPFFDGISLDFSVELVDGKLVKND